MFTLTVIVWLGASPPVMDDTPAIVAQAATFATKAECERQVAESTALVARSIDNNVLVRAFCLPRKDA